MREEARHVPVDRMNRGDFERRRKAGDRLLTILPFARVIATRSVALLSIMSLRYLIHMRPPSRFISANMRSLTMIRCAEAAALAAAASPARMAEKIAA